MAEFVSRVSNYPVVNESCKVAGVAYQWFKGKDSVNHLVTRLEDIASTLALMVKPVTETGELEPFKQDCVIQLFLTFFCYGNIPTL